MFYSMDVYSVFFMLIFGHVLADYPLQIDVMTQSKCRRSQGRIPRTHALFAHSMIHAGMVYLITGYLWIACLELILHFIIDYAKCEGWTSFTQDQALHVICKVLWTYLTVYVLF